jgi:hypothetical protein
MKMLLQRCAAATAAAIMMAPAHGTPCTARSAPALVPLVELYTSEGCSSCPPADRWLNESFAGASNAATALAFHVDYWDDGGWKDRFSSPAYTARQYQVANANHATFVYTPQVVVQGRSTTDWRHLAPRLAELESAPAAAAITLAVTAEGDELSVDAVADVGAPSRRNGAKLYVALASNGLTTQVRGGENRGATLRHDHVVRTLTDGAAVDATGHATVTTKMRATPVGNPSTVIAFVQDPARGDVLQTLALPLARCQR